MVLFRVINNWNLAPCMAHFFFLLLTSFISFSDCTFFLKKNLMHILPVEGRELVRILLTAGADPTAQDVQHRRTALHTAAMANDVELVKVSQVASPM